jgi:hypothetical protein
MTMQAAASCHNYVLFQEEITWGNAKDFVVNVWNVAALRRSPALAASALPSATYLALFLEHYLHQVGLV